VLSDLIKTFFHFLGSRLSVAGQQYNKPREDFDKRGLHRTISQLRCLRRITLQFVTRIGKRSMHF
jgi:hypothetical protein